MLRIAAGEELTLTQQDVGIRVGEVRLRGRSLPGFCHPPDVCSAFARLMMQRVRVDAGIKAEISLHYDPMIAKLVTHGSDREQAAQTMLRAWIVLRSGNPSNIPFGFGAAPAVSGG